MLTENHTAYNRAKTISPWLEQTLIMMTCMQTSDGASTQACKQTRAKKYVHRFCPTGFMLFLWQMGRDLCTEANTESQSL